MTSSAAPVFVVLVNYNGYADTIECVESVLRSDYPRVHVIVVDNGSHDDSVDQLIRWAQGARQHEVAGDTPLKALSWPNVPKPISHIVLGPTEAPADATGRPMLPKLTVIASPDNLGFAGGNNLALRLLSRMRAAGYVWLLNNDIVVDRGGLSAMVRALENDSALGAVGGLILDYQQPRMIQTIGGGLISRWNGTTTVLSAGSDRSETADPARLDYVSGGCLLARLETLRDVGLLDEHFFLYVEDADLGARLRQRGYRLACATDAVVWHKGSRAIGAGSPFQDYHIVRSSLVFARKHAPRFFPVASIYFVFRFLLPKLARGQWTRARSVLRAYADYVADRPHSKTAR